MPSQSKVAVHQRNPLARLISWLNRKIFLYNVTLGLYMLDWWERLLFNMLVLLLIWFLCYNGLRNVWQVSSIVGAIKLYASNLL